jgi:phage terminase large subunit-like protein
MNWHISNVAIQRDPADNVKIDKKRSAEKVDGVVAAVMALGNYIDIHSKKPTLNINKIYETNGIRFL